MKVIVFLFFATQFIIGTQISSAQQDINNPKVRWKFKTDGPVRAGATIAGNSLYLGSTDGTLYCLGKYDGKLLWKYKTMGALTGSPAVFGNSVYVAGRDRFLYRLNAATGMLIWKNEMQADIPDAHAGWDYFMPAPVFYQDLVIVGSGDSHVYAFDVGSGTQRWKFKTNGRVRASALLIGDVVYQPSNDGYVYALDAFSGRELWKFETKGASYRPEDFPFDRSSIFAKPLAKNGLLVLACRDGNAYAVDLNTHIKKWDFTYGTTWAMSSAIAGNTVFVGWSTNNIFCALDLGSGKELWQYQGSSHFYGTPAVLDKGVYMGSAEGVLYRLDKATGDKEWEYPIGAELYTSVEYNDHMLFFGSDNGYFYALGEGENAIKAVYEPAVIEGNAKFLVVDPKITPYLRDKGFEVLDSEDKLYSFLESRVEDLKPSVVVFALPIIPGNVLGNAPENGLMRKYLTSGGKVIWMGDVPNYYEPDEQDQYKRDPSPGSRLLSAKYLLPNDSGNYISVSTQEGRNMGLPSRLKTTGSVISPEGIIPLANDEFGRVNCWMKKFNPRPGSGFISCRSWSWNVPIHPEDLEIIHALATYGLE
jgi:outer membrane protein assembly factor BamB